MTVKRLSLPSLSAILCGGFTLYISFGTLGVTTADAGGSRVGVLPSPWWLLATIAIVALAAVAAGSRRARVLWLSAIVVLAWLPLPVPLAAFMWAGPLRWWVWTAIAVAAAAPALRRLAASRAFGALADPRRAPLIAAVLAAAVYLVAAWQIAPQLPGGDEPHYLIIAQSLLRDGDLRIENNHARGDYSDYFNGPLKPHYLARGANHEIYSVHAPGLPAIVAPVFAAFGYAGVLAFLAIVSGIGTSLAWRGAWLVTGDVAASWFGWASVALSVPFLFQAFTVYPDGLGATLVMAGLLTALIGERASLRVLVATGAGLALLPWMHTRFAVTAAALGVVIVARQAAAPDKVRRIAAFVVAPAISALAWFSFFYVIYRSFNPAVVYGGATQSAIANIPRSLAGLVFDQQFGVLQKAPVYLCALAGLVPLARRHRRVAIELAVIVIPYALAAAMFFMWWGGSASPARFLASVLLPFAIPAAVWFRASGRSTRILGLGALLLSVLISTVSLGVDRGALVYDVRSGAAKSLAWASPLVDLSTGLPSLFQTTLDGALARSAIWLIAIAVTASLAVWLDRQRAARDSSAVAIGLTAAATGMAALSIVWSMNAAQPVTAAKAGPRVLRAIDGDTRQVAVRYEPFGRVPVADVPPLLPLATAFVAPPRPTDPLVVLTDPSAAQYTIEATVEGNPGHLTAGVDRRLSMWTWDLAGVRGRWRQTVTLGNDARALHIDAEPATRGAIHELTIRAERRLAAHERVTDRPAQTAAHYGRATVFLLDDDAYVEAGGSWIKGGASAAFAIVPDPGAPIQLLVRNFAVENMVVLDAGDWHEEAALKPREERLFDVPMTAGRPGVLLRVRSATGARPVDTEPGNPDARKLGCWIETR